MTVSDILARVLAVIAGMVLFFFVGVLVQLGHLTSLLIVFMLQIASYSVVGIALGFGWPNIGWRLGLYLFSILPLIILASVLFSDPPSVVHWREELFVLLGYLMILPGACLGAWIGSILRRRFSRDASPDKHRTLPTS